jgi:hypothetical protein
MPAKKDKPAVIETVDPAKAMQPPPRGLSDDAAADALMDIVDFTPADPELGDSADRDNFGSSADAARARLRESGTLEDAEAALVAMLADKVEGEESSAEGEDEAGDSAPDSESDEAPSTWHEFSADELALPVKVKVQGEDVMVPLSEALAGYQRQSDYSRKTSQLSEQRRTLESERQQAVQTAAQLATNLAVVERFIDNLPQDARAGLTQLRQQAVEYVQHTQEKALHSVLSEESAKLREAMGWEDDTSVQRGKSELVAAARRLYGFEPAHLDGVTDHRALLVLRDAMRYHALTNRTEQVKADIRGKRRLSPTLKPGTHNTSRGQRTDRAYRSDRRAVRQTGRMDDAAKALAHLLDD